MPSFSSQLPENRGKPGCGQDDSSGAAPAGDGLPLVRRQAQSRREQIHQDEAGGEVSWRIHFLWIHWLAHRQLVNKELHEVSMACYTL